MEASLKPAGLVLPQPVLGNGLLTRRQQGDSVAAVATLGVLERMPIGCKTPGKLGVSDTGRLKINI
jgi:hypothetical protein